MNLSKHPHRRFNILTGEWVLVSAHRTKRPWQGKTEKIDLQSRPAYDPGCYLCPGNKRAGGVQNPMYSETFSFINDFSALYLEMPEEQLNTKKLLQAKSEKGICKVLCYSPRHDLSMAKLGINAIRRVIEHWIVEYNTIGSQKEISYVQIFENKGARMGCSNPHPHGQIWADQTVPLIPERETETQRKYFSKHKKCMLCAYVNLELKLGQRIVFTNRSFVALVPFWAVWPFEVMILPKIHLSCISELNSIQKRDLAAALKKLTIRYDNLFKTEFPYSMGIHQKPTDGKEYKEWHFHFHFLPPLLRSATVSKFMVGYELLAMPQRDITAEYSAQKLRELKDVHYTKAVRPK